MTWPPGGRLKIVVVSISGSLCLTNLLIQTLVIKIAKGLVVVKQAIKECATYCHISDCQAMHFWLWACICLDMSFYKRIVDCHFECRPKFVLFTEFIAFVGCMAIMVGLSFVRELLF